MTTSLTQYLNFTSNDYLLSLPMLLLTLFALGILLIDLLLPKQWKQVNAIIALVGLAFSAAAVVKLHYAYQRRSSSRVLPSPAPVSWNSLLVDRFALYFFYLFLVGAAIAILMSMHYLEIEHENHGEFYALLLFSVVGMMCMAAGYDIVLIFIGLELMAISTYVLVGFLRRDKRSNEAALKYLLLGAFSSGIFAYGLSLFYGLTGSTNLEDDRAEAARRSGQRGRTIPSSSSRCWPRRPACCSRLPPCRSISGRPTPTKARPPASPDSCPSR